MPRHTSRTAQIALPARAPRSDTPRLALAKVSMQGERPPNGTARPALPHRGELARHRVMTADGRDVAVATMDAAGEEPGFVSGIYPVQQGYLVMMYQPLYETRSATRDAARDQHEQLVRVLADAGLGVVRARKRRERTPARWRDAAPIPAGESALAPTA